MRTRAVALGAMVAGFLACRKPTPEELIRQRVVQMGLAAEQKDLGFVMEQISPRFRGAGGMTRDELKAFLAAQLFRGDWMRVFPTDLDVHAVETGKAELSGVFLFGQSRAKLLKDLVKETSMQAEEVTAVWEREADGHWRVVSATYRPVSQEELIHRAP